MNIPDFKYIIIGAGTSGLHLINSIVEDQFFRNKESNLIEDISIFISMFSLKYIRVVIASIWIK
jgi:hypothetical protein